MEKFIKLLLRTATEYGISMNQSIILWAIQYGQLIPTSAQDILTLNKKGLLNGKKIEDKFAAKLTELEKTIGKRTRVPSVKRPYKFIYAHILDKVVPEKISSSIQGSVDRLFPEEGELKDYFIAFLYIFPSSSREQNIKWSKHFGVPYHGHKLRVVSKDAHKQFNSVARHYDPDILLFAAYKMVIDSVKPEQNQAFVMKISNFYAEWHERYLEAQALLEKHGDKVFTKVDRNISTRDNMILL